MSHFFSSGINENNYISSTGDSCVPSCNGKNNNNFISSDKKSCLANCPEGEYIDEIGTSCTKSCKIYSFDRKKCVALCDGNEIYKFYEKIKYGK
jgi:hypothetical protein